MGRAMFDTPDEGEIEIDSDEVVDLRSGKDAETTIIELDDGDEVEVIGTRIEVVAELGLNPLEYIDPDDDDDAIDGLIDDEDDDRD